MMPDVMLSEVYARNLERYGDRLGPTIDYFVERGNSWERIIESSARPGGADILPKLLNMLNNG